MKLLLAVTISFMLTFESSVVFADELLGDCLSLAGDSADEIDKNSNYSMLEFTFLSDAKVEEMKALRSSLKTMNEEFGMGMGMGGFGLGAATTGKARTESKSNGPIEIAKVYLDGEFISDIFVFDWSMDLRLNVDKGAHTIKVDFPSHKDYEAKFTAVGNLTRQHLVVRLIPIDNDDQLDSK